MYSMVRTQPLTAFPSRYLATRLPPVLARRDAVNRPFYDASTA